MKTKTAAVFIGLAACIFTATRAQTVVNADSVTLQPTISRDDKGFKSCGVRAVVVVGAGPLGRVYDFSVNVYADSIAGMVKAGKYDSAEILKAKGSRALNAVLPGPTGFWIAKAEQGVPLSAKKYIPGDTPGFILGATEIVPAITAMMGIVSGEQMQFVVQYKNESIERIISFATKMPQTDMKALLACVEGTHVRMEEIGKTLFPKAK